MLLNVSSTKKKKPQQLLPSSTLALQLIAVKCYLQYILIHQSSLSIISTGENMATQKVVPFVWQCCTKKRNEGITQMMQENEKARLGFFFFLFGSVELQAISTYILYDVHIYRIYICIQPKLSWLYEDEGRDRKRKTNINNISRRLQRARESIMKYACETRLGNGTI